MHVSDNLVTGNLSNNTSDTRVAGAYWLVLILLNMLLNRGFHNRFGEGAGNLRLDGGRLLNGRGLGQFLGGTIDDLSVADKALDEPMTFARAVSTVLDTCSTQVVVSIVADVAVVVFVRHRSIASIAEHGPRTGGRARSFGISWSWLCLLDAKGKLAVAGNVCQLRKETFTTQAGGRALWGSAGDLGSR